MNIDLLRAELTRDEGVRLKPYRDSVGKLTIGVGRNLDDRGISTTEADYLLEADVARTVADLDRYLPWWETLDEVRQRVIVNMGFNLGVDPKSDPPGSLTTFYSTLAAMREGRYSMAADLMLRTLWARQVGPRAIRLAEMMRTGEEPKGSP